MEKDRRKISLKVGDDLDIEYMDLYEAIQKLQVVHQQASEQGLFDVRINVDTGYDGYFNNIDFSGYRWETDEEYQQRQQSNKVAALKDAETKAEQELRDYARLKKKFEGGD